MSRSTRAKSPSSSPTDALSQEIAAGEEAAAKEVALIMDGVRYGAFADLDPPLSVGEFLDLRKVAMLRRLFGHDVPMTATRLGRTVATINLLLRHPHFERVDNLIVENARKVGGATSLDELVKEMGVRAGKEMALMAATGPSREKAAMLNALTDRVSPKQGRREKPSNARVFPDNLLETIKLGMELQKGVEQRAIGAGSVDVVDAELVDTSIDGGVLNVPKT